MGEKRGSIYNGTVPEPVFVRVINNLECRGPRLSDFKSCSCQA